MLGDNGDIYRLAPRRSMVAAEGAMLQVEAVPLILDALPLGLGNQDLGAAAVKSVSSQPVHCRMDHRLRGIPD